jgi:hypothetical protein
MKKVVFVIIILQMVLTWAALNKFEHRKGRLIKTTNTDCDQNWDKF